MGKRTPRSWRYKKKQIKKRLRKIEQTTPFLLKRRMRQYYSIIPFHLLSLILFLFAKGIIDTIYSPPDNENVFLWMALLGSYLPVLWISRKDPIIGISVALLWGLFATFPFTQIPISLFLLFLWAISAIYTRRLYRHLRY